jgi:hypothetical protein
MSYYFTILSPTDTPIFNIAFGTSKGGGDGIARFRFPDTAQYMNQFIIHSSLDILEEAQWTNGGMCAPSSLSSYPFSPPLPAPHSLSQVSKTHRHLPPSLSLHKRLPNTQRHTIPPPPPTAAITHER